MEVKVRNDEVTKLFQDLTKPSLNALSYALRHPDTWPVGFVWDYGNCRACAMGLAHQLWNQIPPTTVETGASVMAREFAMPYTEADAIFLKASRSIGVGIFKIKVRYDLDSVTPDMVADQIDAYLKTAE